MARRKKTDAGERFTVKRTLQLTPTQAAELDAAAERQGATWSDFARELMFRRLGSSGCHGRQLDDWIIAQSGSRCGRRRCER